jgi:hypothetical protein
MGRRKKGWWCFRCCSGDQEEVDALYAEIEFLEDELAEARHKTEQRSLKRDDILRDKDEQIKNLHQQTEELEGFLRLADHSFLNQPVRVVVSTPEGDHVLLERFFTLAPMESTTIRDFFEKEACPHMRHRGSEVERLIGASVGIREHERNRGTSDWERASRNSAASEVVRMVQVETLNDLMQRYTKMGVQTLQFFVETRDVLWGNSFRIPGRRRKTSVNGRASPVAGGRGQSRRSPAATREPSRAATRRARQTEGAPTSNSINGHANGFANGHSLSSSVLNMAGPHALGFDDRQPKSPLRRIFLPRRHG